MKRSAQESGYALVSLLVVMTIGLVVMASMASKPAAQFVGQREKEEEAFYRAYQVTKAIQDYAMIKGGLAPNNLPTKIEDLLDKFVIQGRELHIVRKSALIDPLTGTEWKPIRLGDPKVREFVRTYMRFLAEQQALALTSGGGGVAPGVAGQQQPMPPLLMLAANAAGINLNNPSAGDEEEENSRSTSASGFSLDLDGDSRPIVGVMSSLKKPMVRNYYGIESYEKALFFAGVPVPGINLPVPTGGVGVPGGVPGGAPPPGPGEPDTRPKLLPGQCPPGSTDPRCPRNRVSPNQ